MNKRARLENQTIFSGWGTDYDWGLTDDIEMITLAVDTAR